MIRVDREKDDSHSKSLFLSENGKISVKKKEELVDNALCDLFVI